MNKMECITVYLYLRHFVNVTRDEERQRLKTFRILIVEANQDKSFS